MEIYCRQVTPRMLYMADWLGNYLFGYALPVKTASYEIDTEIPVLNYSDEKLPFQAYQVAPSGLLFEQTVQDQCIEVDKNQVSPDIAQGNATETVEIAVEDLPQTCETSLRSERHDDSLHMLLTRVD